MNSLINMLTLTGIIITTITMTIIIMTTTTGTATFRKAISQSEA